MTFHGALYWSNFRVEWLLYSENISIEKLDFVMCPFVAVAASISNVQFGWILFGERFMKNETPGKRENALDGW